MGAVDSPDPDFPAGELVGKACRRVERCETDLRELLADAQRHYKATIAALDGPPAGMGENGGTSLAARVALQRRVRMLQQAAGELDIGIDRINTAVPFLAAAREVLEGKRGRQIPLDGGAEPSVEAVAIQAQEEERYRLAREIHDGPAQILANMAFQVEYISKLALVDPGKAREEMSTLQKDLRLAVGEVRRFMYDLRPPALAQQGVGAAVESHCQRLADRFGLKVAVRWRSGAMLPPPRDTAVFRIVQEALQNVVKHAQATWIEVESVERDGVLEVSVSDNGKGFDRERLQRLAPDHFGLAGMRARAQQIGAALEVTSTPNRGTTILLRVPLSPGVMSNE